MRTGKGVLGGLSGLRHDPARCERQGEFVVFGEWRTVFEKLIDSRFFCVFVDSFRPKVSTRLTLSNTCLTCDPIEYSKTFSG